MINEQWVVTVTWPYLDEIPFLGELIETALSADIFTRYLRSKGVNVVFISRIGEVDSLNIDTG